MDSYSIPIHLQSETNMKPLKRSSAIPIITQQIMPLSGGNL